MTWWQAMILGIVEGLTEYLPVSSTGHLILAQRALGIPDSDAANAYAICIQAGAIVAVLGLYRRRVQQMGQGLVGRDPVGRRLVGCVVAGFLPAAVIGLLLDEWIKANLFGGERWGLWPTVAAWFVGGIAILAVAWHRRAEGESPRSGYELVDLAWRGALVIGFAQCLAMWPGVSRSLVTIVGGVLIGLSLPAAVEFSFLLGVVTLGAATVYDGAKHGPEMVARYDTLDMLIGFAFAWLSAVVAVKWMVSYLKRHGLSIFGYYRVALAIIVAILILEGTLALMGPVPEPGFNAVREPSPEVDVAPPPVTK